MPRLRQRSPDKRRLHRRDRDGKQRWQNHPRSRPNLHRTSRIRLQKRQALDRSPERAPHPQVCCSPWNVRDTWSAGTDAGNADSTNTERSLASASRASADSFAPPAALP
jgi:hypothetical protein